jgi:hypothetical protein
MSIDKDKHYLSLFSPDDLENIPANYYLFDKLDRRNYISSSIFKFTLSTEYNTAKYIGSEFHRPISKIVEFDSENDAE